MLMSWLVATEVSRQKNTSDGQGGKEADCVVILWNELIDCGEQVWGITLKLFQ